jgi:hypothetical protein
MAQVFIADGVAFVKGGTLEFPGANLGNVMGQPCSDGILKFYFFEHGNSSLSEKLVPLIG